MTRSGARKGITVAAATIYAVSMSSSALAQCTKDDRSGCDASQLIAHQCLDAAEEANKHNFPELQKCVQRWIDQARDEISRSSSPQSDNSQSSDGMMNIDVHTAPAKDDDSSSGDQGGSPQYL